METVNTEQAESANDLVWKIAVRVGQYCPGSIGWIARQKRGDEWSNDYGFVIGNGFACVSLEEAHNPTDDLIKRLATEILGYAPDSRQDLETRKANSLKQIEAWENQISYTRNSIAQENQNLFAINAKLDALT